MQEVYGIEDDLVGWTAMALGGGIARCQDVCGALTGGALALGLRQSQSKKDKDERRKEAYEKTRSLYRSFEQRFGQVDCLTLTGHDFNVPDGYKGFLQDDAARENCRNYVAFVVENLMDLEG